MCLSCGEELSPSLERSASLRCHDCRDLSAPIRQELLVPATKLRRRFRLRIAAL
jgi:hypothetical protein